MVAKNKDETAVVAIQKFFELKPKMHSFLVDNSSELKKTKDVNKNAVAAVSHNEYKDALLSNKCLRQSMKRIHCKNYRIGTYEINKISLSCFYDQINIINNGYDGFALGYQS